LTFFRSCTTVSSTPGYWIFTTTSSPPGSTARCTCPSEAAANASGSNRSKSCSGGAPSSFVICSRMTAYDIGGTDDCTVESTSSASGGSRSLRMLSICVSFMNAPFSSVERSTMRIAFRTWASSRSRSVRSCDWKGRFSACQM